MNVEFYTGVDERLDMPVMLPPIPAAIDLTGAKVLIVDDVADTGETLKLVRDFCADHVAEARCAVIYEKPRSVVKCEYVWRRTEAWINFPWSSEPPVTRCGTIAAVTPTPDVVPNVLAARYASAELAQLWSPEHKVVLERRLWIAVLEAQRDLGVDVPEGVIEAYEKVVDDVDLASIRRREAVTRHDVKARIEEFSALAGHEHIHKGMTSRDLTENVEQLQVRSSLELVRDRAVAALARLARLATEHVDLVIAGRSHNVAAQATTLGKRFASAADELLMAVERVESLLERYPLRGIKGPVGTAQDQLDLLDGDADKLAALEQRVAEHLGFRRVLTSVGQVYPRSLDFDVVSSLVQLAAGPSSLATTIRLMAGQELVTEGFQAGQVGLERDAAQDEHPVLRAGQRTGRRAARLPLDGRRAGRRPVERGRRLLLGRAPRRAARRVLRHRRAVRDVPHRARRLRRLPGRRAPRARPLPAVPRDDQGADGRRAQRRRPRAGARGDQGARGRGRARDARVRPRRQRPVRPARRRCPARVCPANSSTRLVDDPLSFTGAAGAQVAAVVARVDDVVRRHPLPPAYTPAADPLAPESPSRFACMNGPPGGHDGYPFLRDKAG